MRRGALLVATLLAAGALGSARAHEVRPGYLELRQTELETFDVTWKVPAKGDLRLGIYARLPESCRSLTPRSTYSMGGAHTDRSAEPSNSS